MFIKAKVDYDDDKDRLSLVNINEQMIQRIDAETTNDGRPALWVVTSHNEKGLEIGYYITDIDIKDMANFLEKHGLLIPILKTNK